MRHLHPLGRLVVAALVAASGLLAARPAAVAAVSCPGSQCATVIFHLSGNGSGSLSTNPDPPYEGCSLNGGVVTGCLRRNFYWTSGDPYLDIDLTFTPTADSYACIQPDSVPEYCVGAGTPLHAGISVYDGESLDLYATFDRAKSLRMTVSPSGTGSGRVTSSPVGIDCGYAGGTPSGTCTHTWYFTGDFPYQLTFTPSATSDFCAPWVPAGTCPGVGKAFTFKYTQTFDESVGFGAVFNRAAKVTVAVQGTGRVASGDGGISCPTKCTAYYKPTVVGLVATAAPGWTFKGWTGACSGEAAVCDVAVNATNLSTTALFASIATPAPPRPTPGGPTAAPSLAASVAPGEHPSPSDSPTATLGGPTPGPSPSAEPVAAARGSSAPSTAPEPAGIGSQTAAASQSGLLFGAVVALAVVLLLLVAIGAFVIGRRRRPSDPSGSGR